MWICKVSKSFLFCSFSYRLEPKHVEAINKHRCMLKKTRDSWTPSRLKISLPTPPSSSPVLSKPSVVTKISTSNVKVHCTFEGRQIGFIFAKRIIINMVNYTSNVSQTSGEIFGCDLVDTSVDTSLHRSILRAIRDDPSAYRSTDKYESAKFTNEKDRHFKIDFHFTSKEAMNSLLEVRLHCARFLYLQRFTMMVVGYIRDFVLPSFRCGPKGDKPSMPNPPGMMRYTISFLQSEVHLPVNSRSLEGKNDDTTVLHTTIIIISHIENIICSITIITTNYFNHRNCHFI